MTSVIPNIQQGLRLVAGDFLSTKVLWRKLLSNAVVEPRLYAPWVSVTGVLTNETRRQEYDPERGRYQTIITRSFRTADNAYKLSNGDQIKLADQTVYGVASIDSSGPGSIRYGLEQVAGSIVAGGDRGAPV